MHSQTHLSTHSSPSSNTAHRVEIADERLTFAQFELSDPIPTGRQITEAFGQSDPVECIVLQWLPNGALEELRLDELADLRATGVERFIVVRSDRSFRLDIDGRRHEWPCEIVTGATIKRLAKTENDDFDVYLARPNEPDLLLDDDVTANLSATGVERFSIQPRPREVLICVNNRQVKIARGAHTGLDIKQTAIAQGVEIQVDFVLSREKPNGDAKVIGDADTIKVRAGDKFTAIADDDNS